MRGRLVLAALVGTAATGSAVALMATSAWLIAAAAARPPVLTLMVAIVAVRAFGIGRGVLRYLERLISHQVAFRVLAQLRVTIVDRVIAMVGHGWAFTRAGILTRTVDDVDATQDALLRGALPLITAGITGAAAVLTAAMILPSVALAMATTLIVGAALIPAAVDRRTRRLTRVEAELRGNRNEIIGTAVTHVTDLEAVGALTETLELISSVEGEERRVQGHLARLAGIGALAATLATGAAAWAAALLGVPRVVDGSLAAPLLAVLVLMPLALTEAVTGATAAIEGISTTRASVARLAELLDPDTDDAAVDSSSGDNTPVLAPEVVLRLDGVSARWPGADRDALTDVTLELRPGQRIVVTGESGSGKSTLAAVILGLLPIRAGTITVNGHQVSSQQLRDLGLSSWSDQSAQLFGTSIAENLKVADPQADTTTMLDACQRAGLGTWIKTLPKGLDTVVGDRGAALSGGQRQRLALARALIAKRPILIADEITAQLDQKTADDITAGVMDTDATRCVLLITHREADTSLADTIVTLTDGITHVNPRYWGLLDG